jgi:hypothetical protein
MADPDRQEFRTPTGESRSKLRKLTIGLAVAGVSVFLIAITTNFRAASMGCQHVCAAVTITSLAAAVLSGMLAWYADAERCYFGAAETEPEDLLTQKDFKESWELWCRRTWMLTRISRWTLYLSIVTSVCYVVARTFER